MVKNGHEDMEKIPQSVLYIDLSLTHSRWPFRQMFDSIQSKFNNRTFTDSYPLLTGDSILSKKIDFVSQVFSRPILKGSSE
jgi:hypothetical protein